MNKEDVVFTMRLISEFLFNIKFISIFIFQFICCPNLLDIPPIYLFHCGKIKNHSRINCSPASIHTCLFHFLCTRVCEFVSTHSQRIYEAGMRAISFLDANTAQKMSLAITLFCCTGLDKLFEPNPSFNTVI